MEVEGNSAEGDDLKSSPTSEIYANDAIEFDHKIDLLESKN